MSIPAPSPSTMATKIINSKLAGELTERWPVAAVTIVTLIAALVLPAFFKKNYLAQFPMVGGGQKEFMKENGGSVYAEGYKKFKKGIFRITTSTVSPNIIISPSFLPEIKNLPDDVVSFGGAVKETMHGKYTGIHIEANLPQIAHTVKTSLTPALARLNPIVSEEVEESMRLELPQSASWTEVCINAKLLRIVAMVSGRIFVGPELCRTEAYLDAAINYTVDLMTAVHRVAPIPTWLRPIMSPFLPQVKKLQERVKVADQFLRPIVEERRKGAENEDWQKPNDMLQWIIDSQHKFGKADAQHLARVQLEVSFAAIHTTTLTTTNAIYTLAVMPELAPMLREDVQQALLESGGEFTSIAMQHMKKLDSFLKEIIRYYPMSAASFQRKVLKPFTLSNGQTIPAGVIIELPQGGVNFDEAIYPNPHTFDALRFYNLRMAKESGAKAAEVVANSQFVSVGANSLTFGYGRHACPGRFFAVNEIKMIMAQFLMHYDIKNVDGEMERYKNLKAGHRSIPDPSKKIMIRKL